MDVYDGVKRLAKLLNIEFKFNPSKSQTIRASTHPEAKIAALIVIATKLSHPFDGIVRIPRDAPSLTMNWSAWKDAMAEKKTDGLKRGQEIHVTDRDVLSMSGDQLDDYLNWYQQMWIDGTEPKSKFVLKIWRSFVLKVTYSATETVGSFPIDGKLD